MSIIDDAVKILKSIKIVDVKNEIKSPTVAPVVNYNSPTNNTFNFQSVEINNAQLVAIADKVSDSLMENIKTQIVGKIASDLELQNEVSKLSPETLPVYLRTAMVGTATLSEVQPNFVTAGTTVFPQIENVFQAGYETGSRSKRVENVRIIRNPDGSITIQYDET